MFWNCLTQQQTIHKEDKASQTAAFHQPSQRFLPTKKSISKKSSSCMAAVKSNFDQLPKCFTMWNYSQGIRAVFHQPSMHKYSTRAMRELLTVEISELYVDKIHQMNVQVEACTQSLHQDRVAWHLAVKFLRQHSLQFPNSRHQAEIQTCTMWQLPPGWNTKCTMWQLPSG